ncbi:hypothetical protein [Nocardioides zhouii]|uniref:Big-1 domain-containing protein n=1 Tax=Nocardioides zhouii TaxID=1168729 RepID=A0A4Q2SJ52_9ACTN|nr:hypothetical protein [Nocardioides zhouii]RYC05585.1 hypothetical protein EUA94_18515 [Nocardioides zhouii]
MSFPASSRRKKLALAIAAGLAVALSGAVTSAAPAANTAPVVVVVDSVTSDVVIPSGLPGAALPYVVVKAGGTIRVTVSFLDALGQPAAFTKDTRLTVSSNVGTLSSTTGLARAGEQSAVVATSLTAPVNRVVLTVGAGSGPKAPAAGTSYVPGVKDLRFDVLSDLSPALTATNGSAFAAGFGGQDSCVQATEAAPVCEVVLLPRGAGSQVLLSVGVCDTDRTSTYAPCFRGAKGVVGGAVAQALFSQPSSPYEVDSPATIIVKCDKTLCGGGSIRGVSVIYSLLGNGSLAAADACPAKNTMAAPATPCVDYVQSKRDGSGDTHLYLLTDRDIRTGIG